MILPAHNLDTKRGGGGAQRHIPAVLSPTKTRYLWYRELDGPHGQSGRVRKISTPLAYKPRHAHVVGSNIISPIQKSRTEDYTPT
jgi:hypothetical protein